MSFDRLAPHYRWMEAVSMGGKLQQCRRAWLDKVRECDDVLIVGEGPGRFLQTCARKLPTARLVCVDASRAMLARAQAAWRRSGGNAERIEFIHASLPEWNPPASAFDLIVTHFFLDCFPEPILSAIVARLAAASKPRAQWLVADFQIPPNGLARLRAQVLLAVAYKFFRVTTKLPANRLESPDAALVREGFQLRDRRTFDYGLLRSDRWQRD